MEAGIRTPPMSSKETALRSPRLEGRAPTAPFLSPLPTRQAARGPRLYRNCAPLAPPWGQGCVFISFASMEAGICTPHFLCLDKENGPCTVQKKPLKSSPKMTSPGHFGGHVPAERLWAVTLRPLSGSRRGMADTMVLRRVWGPFRREGGPGHLALLFCCRRLALPEESGAAAKREAGGVRARPVPVVPWQKALHLRAVSPEANLSPRPRKVRKSPTAFSARGCLFLRPSFSAPEKEGPPCGQHPRRGARYVLRRHQPAFPRHISKKPELDTPLDFPPRLAAFAPGRRFRTPSAPLFAPAVRRFRKRAVRQRKEEQGVSGRAPGLWFRGRTALGARKTVGNHGHSSPAPGKSEKVPRSFSARGRPFSSSFFFGRDKEGPRAGSTPPPAAFGGVHR